MQQRVAVIFYLAFVLLLNSSCTNSSAVRMEPYKNNLGIKPSVVAQIDTAHYTSIKWINPVCNMGSVNEGDSVMMKFWYENTGKHPLFISAVEPSCGCTIPVYRETALLPGEKDYLSAFFNTHNQEGHIDKIIVVTTNTAPAVKQVVRFLGKVSPKKTTP